MIEAKLLTWRFFTNIPPALRDYKKYLHPLNIIKLTKLAVICLYKVKNQENTY